MDCYVMCTYERKIWVDRQGVGICIYIYIYIYMYIYIYYIYIYILLAGWMIEVYNLFDMVGGIFVIGNCLCSFLATLPKILPNIFVAGAFTLQQLVLQVFCTVIFYRRSLYFFSDKVDRWMGGLWMARQADHITDILSIVRGKLHPPSSV